MKMKIGAVAVCVLFLLANVTANAQTNTFPASGDVGIGTTQPGYPLTVETPPGANTTAVTSQLTDGVRNMYEGIFAKSASALWGPTFFSDTGYNFVLNDLNNVGWSAFNFYNNATPATDLSSLTPLMSIQANGDVGIGTTSPGATLEVNGNVKLSANSGGAITFQDGTVQSTAYTGTTCGGDYAESVDVIGKRKKYEPGDVLVISSDDKGDVAKSIEAYSTAVVGIYSTKPGTVGRRQTGPKSPNEVPMAMIGIVPTKVSAENGSIHRGDLLVTSSTPGYAMKGTDRGRMLGAVIGKALGDLDSGKGVIEVVVTLQ